MKTLLKILSLSVASMFIFSAVGLSTGCGNSENEASFFSSIVIAQADGSEEYIPSINAEHPEEVEIALLSGDIYTVSKEYTRYITDNYNPRNEDVFAPTPIKISWTSIETPLYYEFVISTQNDMSNATTYVINNSSVTLENLFMGYDYYYQINAKFNDKLVKSRIFKFSTEYLPRTVFVDENVSNTRDWGGYYTVDGKHRVKQGIVYRGGKLESISEKGKAVMLDALGIKTDLDVRGDGTGSKSSPLGDTVNYVETLGPYYLGATGIDFGSHVAENRVGYKDALIKEIRTFTNPANFPVYVHCSLGRDRTGTICFLINALLGVGETDLFRDYELSMMSQAGTADNQTANHMVGYAFNTLYNYIKNFQIDKTLAENAEAYMLSIGITQDEIDAIRNNMLEKA